MRRLHTASLVWLAAALLAACGARVKEGTRIEDMAGVDEPEKAVPVVQSAPIAGDSSQAMDNYRKLLDLPQDPVSRAETLRRLADLQLDADESSTAAPDQVEARMRESIALYSTLLKEQPDLPTNDRVLYQIARAYQNVGETGKAEEALLTLTKKYPKSEYMDDARFRRAELLFKLGQFDEAETEYKYVADLKEQTPFFEPAQYKYGWSAFKQSKYDQALDTFLTVLTRELPAGELVDEETAIAGVKPGKKDFAKDALRVSALCLSYMGGGEAANQYFARRGEPPYAPLLFRALGDSLLEKKRYTDAARAFTAFNQSHPKHALAPVFQGRAIAAEEAGGFTELAMQEKERYAKTFDPSAAYWAGRSPSPEVLKDLRAHLEDLGRYHQATGQRKRAQTPPDESARSDFVSAVGWYRRLLDLFPTDPKGAELHFLLAESMLDSGQTLAAAAEYNRVASDFPNFEKAPEAAYAALLAYERNATEVPEPQKAAALKQAVTAALALAERYPQHPQALAALTRAAEDQHKLGQFDAAAATAAKVLAANPPDELRRTAMSVTADAEYSRKNWAAAEAAYLIVLQQQTLKPEDRQGATERMATSIYKQGEAAREAGKLDQAADAFLRVGALAPASSVRATADYDAAAALIAIKDWTRAASVLEHFREANPSSPLLPEVDKKLAVVYQNSGRPRNAVAVLERIAQRPTESGDTRTEAAWMSVKLLEQVGEARVETAYLDYLRQHPLPMDHAIEARQRLVELAAKRNDEGARLERLRNIVAADRTAGANRSDATRLAAARAALELGRTDARAASRIALRLPLKTSLASRKQATERALATLTEAAEYGFADTTPAATYELGVLYQDLSKALLDSQRPKPLSALELEQYNVLLEEQAFPFEEKAIQFHEANIQRVSQGIYNDWIGKSLQALAQLSPGKYGKKEQTSEVYDALR